MASTLITDYLGKGLTSARPASPPINSAACATYYATDTGIWWGWNGTAWTDLRRLNVRLQAQWTSGAIVFNDTIYFVYDAPYPGTILSLRHFVLTGSFSLAVQIAGVNVGGLAAVAPTTTPTTTSATSANTFTAGQAISGVISGASGLPQDALLSLAVTWTP
jgi:hypothetical protein